MKSTQLSPLVLSLALMGFLGCKTPQAANQDANLYSLDFLQKNPGEERQVVEDPQVKIEPQAIDTGAALLKSKSREEDIPKITVPKPPKPFYEKFLGEDADEKEEVSLVFDAASISDVAAAFSRILGMHYTTDPEVAGSVTMNCDTQMSKRELWALFERCMSFSGAYCQVIGDVVNILPVNRLSQNSQAVNARVFPLRYTSASVIAEKIKPILSEGGLIITQEETNALMVLDYDDILNKVAGLLVQIDSRQRANWPMVVIPCQNVSSLRLAKELQGVLPILGFPVDEIIQTPGLNTSTSTTQPTVNRNTNNRNTTTNASSNTSSGAVQMVSLDRIQVLIVSAANQEAIDEIQHWASLLDRRDVGEQEGLFVYKVNNSRAEELLQFLQTMFVVTSYQTVGEEENELSNSTNDLVSTTTNSSSRNTRSSSSNTNNTSAVVDSNGAVSIFDIPMRIVADTTQNRLVIRTTPRAYTTVEALLRRLDTPPLQVLLEVIISEVTLTKNTEFGVRFNSAENPGGYDVELGTTYSGLDGGYGLALDISKGDKMAYLRALAGDGKVEVLSRPHVVVRNNQSAVVNVGDRVPIISSDITTAGNSNDVTRSYTYEDTGTILQVLPRITEEGFISLDVVQEVSDVSQTNSSNIDSPTISTRKIQTYMQIKNGNTVLIGGLIRDRYLEQYDSIPWIAKIPVLGRLLGYTDREKTKTELVMMITGHIISPENGSEAVLRRYREAVRLINEHLNEENQAMEADAANAANATKTEEN